MILLLLALACPSREIPPHLQIDRPAAQATVGQARDLSDLIGADPLVRRPKPRGPGDWMGVKGGPAIEAWAAVARGARATPSDWTTLERSHPGTIAVPLARGAKLAALEVVLAQKMDEPQQQQVAG